MIVGFDASDSQKQVPKFSPVTQKILAISVI